MLQSRGKLQNLVIEFQKSIEFFLFLQEEPSFFLERERESGIWGKKALRFCKKKEIRFPFWFNFINLARADDNRKIDDLWIQKNKLSGP